MILLNSTKIAQAEPGFEVNIYHPASIANPAALVRFGQELGVKFSSALWYQDWNEALESGIARGINSQGAIPMLVSIRAYVSLQC